MESWYRNRRPVQPPCRGATAGSYRGPVKSVCSGRGQFEVLVGPGLGSPDSPAGHGDVHPCKDPCLPVSVSSSRSMRQAPLTGNGKFHRVTEWCMAHARLSAVAQRGLHNKVWKPVSRTPTEEEVCILLGAKGRERHDEEVHSRGL